MKTYSNSSSQERASIRYVFFKSQLKRLTVCLVFLWAYLGSLNALQAQQTYDFSTPASLSKSYPGDYYTTVATFNVGGVSYTISGGINGNLTNVSSGGYNNSPALRKDGAGGESFTLKRTDGGRFQFYGFWLKQSSIIGYPGTPPYCTITLRDGSNTLQTMTENSNETAKLYTTNVAVTSVQVSFNGVLTHIVDHITVGPAAVSLPILTTSNVSKINSTVATLGGNISNDGGGPVSERGIVWSTSQNPTTANNKQSMGSGTGSFSGQLSGLSKNTTYYARAYAINSGGTAYGSQVSFTTLLEEKVPTIWNGPKLTFTKADYTDYTQAANQDRITDNTWITRANQAGVFNINKESSFSRSSSPANTEWAYGTLDNYASLNYVTWANLTDWDTPSSVGKDAVLHLIEEDIYVGIKFLSWTAGANGGGFSYERTTQGVTASSNSNLSALTLSAGTLAPAFNSGTLSYTSSVPNSTTSIMVTPTTEDAKATVTVNNTSVSSGNASLAIPLSIGSNNITVKVVAEDNTAKTYTIDVTRVAASLPKHALSFNGTDQYVAVPYNQEFEFVNGTVEMWIKPDWQPAPYTTAPNPCVVSQRNTSNTRYSIHVNSDLKGIGIWNGSQYQYVNYDFTKGEWYHVAAVMKEEITWINYPAAPTFPFDPYNPSPPYTPGPSIPMTTYKTEFYVNGNLIGSTSNSLSKFNTGYDFKIGSSEGVTPELFKGEIDEVRVWNQARSATQIKDNMSAPIAPESAGLVAYYQVDENVLDQSNSVDQLLKDYGTRQFDGKLYNYFASSNANLNALALSSGALTPAFSAATTSYTVTVPYSTSSVMITPTVENSKATVKVNGTATTSGNASAGIPLNVGNNSLVVLVTAENNTTKTYTISVTREEPPFAASISSQTNVSCYGGSNGSATVSISAGTSPYTYSWSPSGGTSATATGLSAGVYTVTVTDNNGLTTTAKATITQPTALMATASQTNVSCNGGSNGAATVTPTGGTAPYTYSWSNTATTASITGITAGTYTVTVTDANGCQATAQATITEPTNLTATASLTNVSCNGGSNGAASVTPSGGTAPYTYLWSNTATTASITGITAGTYSVTVTDANGCQATRSFTITEPTALLVSTSKTDATTSGGGSNGIATAAPSGGTAPYTYLWSTGATTATITGLQQGTYTIYITDANNCKTQQVVTIVEQDDVAPAGYAVAFDQARVDVTNVSNASVSITGAEVGTTYAYSIQSSKGGTPITGTGTVSAASFQLANLDLAGLNDGTLTISLQLTDAATNQGAAATAEVVKITRNIVSVAKPATMQVPIRTTFGNIGLPAQIEVTYSTGEKEAIAVTWLQGNYNGFVAGPYTLTGNLTLAAMTTNIDGHKASITVEVQPNKAPTALALSKNTFKPNTTAADVIGEFATTDADDPAAPLFEEHVYTLVSGQGDTDNSLFEIRGKKLHLRSNYGLSGQVSFTIRVRSTDPYSNTIEKSFTLQKTAYEVATEDVKIVNAFSPNGDGFNDNWTIPELRFYNNVYIQVFDRSGVRVFETTDPETGWNGRANNGQLLKGPYLYIVEVKDINWVKRGVVTILSK